VKVFESTSSRGGLNDSPLTGQVVLQRFPSERRYRRTVRLGSRHSVAVELLGDSERHVWRVRARRRQGRPAAPYLVERLLGDLLSTLFGDALPVAVEDHFLVEIDVGADRVILRLS